jgi:site-specific DNA-methyltransferase (adenine-specific)
MELNKIYNESNLDTMAKMPDCFIDLTVTSPPYDNIRNYNGYSFPFEDIAKELFRVTKEGGVVVWVINDATINGSETGTSFKQALYFMECGFNLHDTMIWEKHTIPQNGNRYESAFEYMFVFSKGKPKTFNPIKVKKIYTDNRKTKKYQRNKDGIEQGGNVPKITEKLDYNIWKIDVGGGIVTKDKIAHKHPAIFPDKLAKRHIYSWSNENDVIYDPFCGSGTTMKMAHLQKRKWIGSEISKEYTELANKRLKPYLTQTALF